MKIYCDGGARGNPGPAASAIVIYSGDKIIYEEAKFLGISTNNVAEYSALLMALNWLTKNGTEDTEIFLDSELVQKQMTGEYKIKSPNIKPLAVRAKEIEKTLSVKVSYVHTRRAGNAEADRLVNEALDKAKNYS